MPRLKASARSLPGPLVTTSGQVIRGAGSPGQQVWTGSRPRSISAPRSTTSWHGARAVVFGFIVSAALSSGTISTASRQPPGGSGCLRNASSSPSSRSWCGSRFMPQATRSTVPNRLVSTGMPAALDVLEQHRGPVLGEQAGVDLGDLEHGRDRRFDPDQPAGALQALDEVAQRLVGHGAPRAAEAQVRPPPST